MLTVENYHSPAMNKIYMGSSQYKSFAGTAGMKGCEAKALAELRGEWKEESSTAMLVGAYVDAHFEGSLGTFKAQNPDIFTQKGTLKSEYKRAEEVIARIERDEYFMKMMSGEKQKIFTGELFGVQWKVKLDSFLKGIAIVDLKCMKAIRDSFNVKDRGRISFVEYWGYDIQLAIYQKIVEICTGEKLPCYIAVATKEEFPDIEIIGIDQMRLDTCINEIEMNIKRIVKLKNGELEPERCELCDYCKHTKKLIEPIHYSELIEQI